MDIGPTQRRAAAKSIVYPTNPRFQRRVSVWIIMCRKIWNWFFADSEKEVFFPQTVNTKKSNTIEPSWYFFQNQNNPAFYSSSSDSKRIRWSLKDFFGFDCFTRHSWVSFYSKESRLTSVCCSTSPENELSNKAKNRFRITKFPIMKTVIKIGMHILGL